MSVPRCGYCDAPTMVGKICRAHWQALLQLLRRCRGLEADLGSAIARQGRHGEVVSRSTNPGLPINLAAVDVRRALLGVLCEAWQALGATGAARTVDSAAASILSRQSELQRSWVAPALLGDLEVLVPRAVAATDKPKRQPGVRSVCPRCGEHVFLRAVMGALECPSCRERSSIGEVRSAG